MTNTNIILGNAGGILVRRVINRGIEFARKNDHRDLLRSLEELDNRMEIEYERVHAFLLEVPEASDLADYVIAPTQGQDGYLSFVRLMNSILDRFRFTPRILLTTKKDIERWPVAA